MHIYIQTIVLYGYKSAKGYIITLRMNSSYIASCGQPDEAYVTPLVQGVILMHEYESVESASAATFGLKRSETSSWTPIFFCTTG